MEGEAEVSSPVRTMDTLSATYSPFFPLGVVASSVGSVEVRIGSEMGAHYFALSLAREGPTLECSWSRVGYNEGLEVPKPSKTVGTHEPTASLECLWVPNRYYLAKPL